MLTVGTEQVRAYAAVPVAREQVKATGPPNPLEGVTVTVAVPD
jgi:hypothetical protein